MKRKRTRRMTRGQKRRLYMIIGALAAALVIVLAATAGLQWIRARRGESQAPVGEETIKTPAYVTKMYLEPNEYSRPGDPLEEVNGIVIHYVGNPNTSAKNNRNYFNSLASTGATYASSHFIVGLEGEVIQCVPLDEISYCSNSRNADTVAIECCHPDETGEFNEMTYASLVKLAGWLCYTYELDEEQVIRHYDVKGKLCPLYYVEHEDAWLQMKKDIMAEKEALIAENAGK